MERVNDWEKVQEQYRNADNLNIRIALHQRYSTNRQPFGDWIFEQYELKDNQHILEVGCGDGSMWRSADERLPAGARLLLTDFSSGMLSSARENVKSERVSFLQADIQALPFPDHCFDQVMGHMMLYHVPDLDRGLSQVRRVLKPGGAFYCATYGENGITSWLQDLLWDYGVSREMNKTFTLQNGEAMLRRHFDHVEMRTREDSLEITCADDLLDYIFSMTAMMGAAGADRETLKTRLLARQHGGVIHIPKEYGMFIAR